MGSPNVSDAHAGLANKWRGILEAEGVPPNVLTNRHQPCPICKGKDRFRFDDKGIGRFFCSHCGSGDGFKFLMLLNGISFAEAMRVAKEHAGYVTEDDAHKERTAADKRKALMKAWAGAHANEPGLRGYLAGRGIDPELAKDRVLRWHPALAWAVPGDDGRLRRGSHAAMLARYFQWGAKGELSTVTIHRIWPTGCPKKKMVMPPVVDFQGIFCPLGPKPGAVLGICEGVESALALRTINSMNGIDDYPVWAVYSSEEMKKFNPPEGIQQLHIGVDIDYSWTGQAAGYELARRLRVSRPEIVVSILRPTAQDGIDWDFNDELKDMLKR